MRIPARPTIRRTRWRAAAGRLGRGACSRSCGARRSRAEAALTMASSVMSDPDSSATSRPARITRTRCASPRISSTSFEMSRTPSRPRRDGPSVVDVAFRPDVDATGRLVGDEHTRVDQKRSGEQQLLLVATRECAGRRLEERRSDRPSPGPRGPRRARPTPNEPEPGEAPRLGRLTFSRIGRRRINPSSLRDSGMSATPAAIDAAGRPARAVPETRHRAGCRRRRAVDRPGELGAAGADEPGQPDDLAGPQRQRGVDDARRGQTRDVEDDGASAAGGRFSG